MGDYLAAHPELSPVLRRWGALAFTLSEDEKLLGRALALAERPLSEPRLRQRTGLGRSVTQAGLRVLSHVGLLVIRDDGLYQLASAWRERLGPLGWSFHRVAIEGEAPFNVP